MSGRERGPLLEVIALDAADAVAAQEGGADRLELVSDIAADGLTPRTSTVREVLASTDLPVRVMLRDAAGFAPADLEGLRRRAAELRAAGAEEFVLGFLDGGGAVDVAACAALLAELEGCRWTFHRALDHAADRDLAWAAAVGLGCDAVLTAGSPLGVEAGIDALLDRAARRENGVELLVGGGLRSEHVAPLRAAGVLGFHVGGMVRAAGWDSPVEVAKVASLRTMINGGVPA
ncbi:copper homeostasis protein [Streptoalloteichus tenebrarius]|uniref:Copper homeostasis protein cutC homolog n=1 Tax=Streptoalloteichus tenebrarius (strain ATCC 17920 / DSM 40477 / JCM 4838 / CBS 697.72 / NBRC 16177 / NCIMB 11028 / NRRL B-12390 / A12253. 1 / ISP 5477) TaxID=1933 RepID=A0ABT1HVB5_STRSD|nr:copper homeostasis protein CutC [Streptoalloteichus tenebrarius]MCP2259473.1 copper homeostasis protein [Streptoalloteichus tenebrarius]BFF01449.1 copper homeostasis protein [Streptoalloteichus tenebrarius]